MMLTSGTRLGSYEILAEIGAGGMGEVYRARDTKLGRDVAMKVLPEAFARDADRMARFQREAKVLASLNHPNIASIYGLEDSGSTRALVMQLAEGPTLAERIAQGATGPTASLTGRLVYASAGNPAAGVGQLTLLDRQEKILGTIADAGFFEGVAFSPDGTRVAASRLDLQNRSENLWITDLASGISKRLTFDSGRDFLPLWSPDSSRIVFTTVRDGSIALYEKLSNGSGGDDLLYKVAAIPESWSGDGGFLVFDTGGTGEPEDKLLRLDGNAHAVGKPIPFAQKGLGFDIRFSPGPQGRPLWFAYSSNDSGRYEVYVRPFDPNSPNGVPPGGGKWQVSTNGGVSPRWNANGKELFYVAPDGTVMSVEVSGSNGVFQSGIPKALFKPKGVVSPAPNFFYWDASADGKKFVFPVSTSANAAAPPARFTVVLNWTSLLRPSAHD